MEKDKGEGREGSASGKLAGVTAIGGIKVNWGHLVSAGSWEKGKRPS